MVLEGAQTNDRSMARARSILLVDDEPDIVEAIAGWLEMNLDGLRVERASSGDAAIAALDRDYDLIVSDYRMPGIDGLDFLRLAIEACPNTPTVLMTAYPDADLAERAIGDVCVSRVLVKPVDPDAFLGIVDAMTSRWDEPAIREEAATANRQVLDALHRQRARSGGAPSEAPAEAGAQPGKH